jgi:hypothetical protein
LNCACKLASLGELQKSNNSGSKIKSMQFFSLTKQRNS